MCVTEEITLRFGLTMRVCKKKTEDDGYSRQVQPSAGVAMFIGDRAHPEHGVRVGRSFLQYPPMNQPVEVASVRQEFAAQLGVPHRPPGLKVRFGIGTDLPMSLRRPVKGAIRSTAN
jgi:hypothetical protein